MQGKCVVIGGLLLATGIASAQVPRTRDNPAVRHAPPVNEVGGCQAFFEKALFDAFNQSDGKTLKGIEDFEESDIGDGLKLALPAPLQGGVPTPGFPNGLTQLNLLIQDNITPGPSPALLNPSGDPNALFVIGMGFLNANSKKVGEDIEVLTGQEASTDLIFSGANKSGVGFELSHFQGFDGGSWIVAVYDINNNVIGKFDVPDAIEPAKQFFGIWCDTPIGRINIWDRDIAPDAIDNIQMWVDQVPTCPWDCQPVPDKNVGINDFLALLGGWNLPGPCDFDGGGVGITDFLTLLAHWGPCPSPINDECTGKIFIDRFDSGGTHTEHFDMYGATPSPDPSQCLPVRDEAKDIWYCLQNSTMDKKIVTLSGSVDLLAEVTVGCDCANPGSLVVCGRLIAGVPTTFTMQAGEQVCIRLLNDRDLPNDAIKGDLIITNEPVGPGQLNFFFDPALFFDALQQAGKLEKFLWNFKPDFAPPNVSIGVVSPLDINTHFVNAPDVWFDGVTNRWPPEVDNVQFATNLNPQGPFNPGQFLGYIKGGSDGPLFNNALVSTDSTGLDSSLTIFSGPPAPVVDNHTAMQLEIVSLGLPGEVAVIHVTVYDKSDAEIGKQVLTLQAFEKAFIGFITKDPDITIGRVDIWDVNGSDEGISAIAAYNLQVPPTTVRFHENPNDFFGNLPGTKVTKFTWGFKPDNVPQGSIVPLQDPVDIFTHTLNAPGVWVDDNGMTLWPPDVDNVQFASNINPQGPYGQGAGLNYHKGPTPLFQLDNNALIAEEILVGQTSFTIFSGPPAVDNHTAFELEIVSATPGVVAVMHISVYDKQEVEIGKYVLTMLPTEKRYLGIVSQDTIGRIDIWDTNGGEEGISAITAWQDDTGNPFGCPGQGDCCDPAGNGTPGCNNTDCCRRVCAVEPICCDPLAVWDSLCAQVATQFLQCQCPRDIEPCLPPDCPSGDDPVWCVYDIISVQGDPFKCKQRGIFVGGRICVTPCPFPGDVADCDPNGLGSVVWRTFNGCVFVAVPVNGCEPCPDGIAQWRRIN